MANRYLRASGNWNGPVWAATSGGSAGSAATPTASDNVAMQDDADINFPMTKNLLDLETAQVTYTMEEV